MIGKTTVDIQAGNREGVNSRKHKVRQNSNSQSSQEATFFNVHRGNLRLAWPILASADETPPAIPAV